MRRNPLAVAAPTLAALAVCLSLVSPAVAQVTGLAAVAKDGAVRIEFALARPADVEVAVLNAAGDVVRHLAAGVVGKGKAAPPLAAGSLAQSLAWDGLDDAGLPAAGGPFRVRVRSGMQPRFGRVIGYDPYLVSDVAGLAIDEQGRLFVMSQSYRAGGGKSGGPRYIQIFTPGGKFVRTIMPYSAGLPRDAVAGFGLIDTGGPLTPRNYEGVWPQVYPLLDLHLQPRVAGGRHLLFCDYESLYRITTDGAAVGGFAGTPLWAADKPRFHYNQAGPLFVAPSPDGKRLYISGPYADPKSEYTRGAMAEAWPKGRVYVLDLEAGGGAKTFADVPTERERDRDLVDSAKTLRRRPHGPVHDVACDAKGNVYVCDRANDRIAIYDPAGKLIGHVPVRQPHLVAVHPATGAIYVVAVRPLAYRRYESRLLKFAGPTATQPAASLDLPAEAERPTMLLDVKATPAALWLAGVHGVQVWRVVEKGDTFEKTGELPLKSGGALWGADRIAVDRQTDDVYVNDGWSSLARYNGLTGVGGILGDGRALTGVWERDTNQRTNLTATDAAVGPEGLVYLRNGPRYSGPITVWTRQLAPAPLAATGTHVLTNYIYSRYGAGYGERGFDIHPDGRVFVLSMYDWAKYFVHVFSPEGRPLNSGRLKGAVKAYDGVIDSGLIGPLTGECGGLKVDAAGNVYVGMRLLPDGLAPPAGFEKDPAYGQLVGSVFKFRPGTGGVVSGAGPAGAVGIRVGRQFVEGAVAAYADFGVFSGRYGSGCACRNPRFDLDPYGRLYVPNPVRFSVAVVDNAGNPICRFGQYGNPDDASGGERICFGWPIGVAASERAIYVSDMLDKRVVRVDIQYAAAAEVPLPAAAPTPAGKLAAAERLGLSLRPQVVKLAPYLDRDGFWGALALALTRSSTPPTAEDAKVNVCHMTRWLPGMPAAEVRALAASHLADPAARVRLAALWAANREDAPQVATDLAVGALHDKDERVRTLAAIMLFDRNSGEGLSVILDGVQGTSPWVLDMTRPVSRELVLMDEGPAGLKYPPNEAEVGQLIRMLANAYNNTRWVAAGALPFAADPRVPAALAGRLADEDISMVRKRLIHGLAKLRAREGVPPLLADVAAGPGDRKRGTGWDAADALAEIGDPATVAPLIRMLDQPASADLALFTLSRAFDGSIEPATESRLLPDAAGHLQLVPQSNLPPPAQRRQAWQRFWDANAARYPWKPDAHSLRVKITDKGAP